MIIKRCLTYGIKISPYQLNTVLNQYEIKKIPDNILADFNGLQVEKYVKGLYLCGQEMAYDWTKGHEILKELGVTDFAIEMDTYLQKGGKAEDYLNAKGMDWNSVGDDDLVKSDLRKKYPDFTKQEIDRKFNRQYGVTDDMTDEEREDRLLDLKGEAYQIRQSKIAEQQKFKVPDTQIMQKDEVYEQWKQQGS